MGTDDEGKSEGSEQEDGHPVKKLIVEGGQEEVM